MIINDLITHHLFSAPWNNGILEYGVIQAVIIIFKLIEFLQTHYSIVPIFQHSNWAKPLCSIPFYTEP